MAIQGHRDYELAIHPFFVALDEFINNRAMNFGISFEAHFSMKRSHPKQGDLIP